MSNNPTVDKVGQLLDELDEVKGRLELVNRRNRDLEAEIASYRTRLQTIRDLVNERVREI